MLIAAFVLTLYGPVAAPMHAESASRMPVGGVVPNRSAIKPGEQFREVCYRGKRTGSNIIEDLCQLVPVEADKSMTARR